MKLAIVFPGIGYHSDKPLLYYSKKIARMNGYEIVEVKYENLPTGVKNSEETMNQCISMAVTQAYDMLSQISYDLYEDILFLSKSIGTAVAASCSNKLGIETRNIYYTPIAQSFEYMKQPGIVFHGNADDWVVTKTVIEGCKIHKTPLYIIDGANHSLEVGDGIKDIEILQDVMSKSRDYIIKK